MLKIFEIIFPSKKQRPWTDEEIEALVEDAKMFYESRGVVLTSEWMAMDSRTKAIFHRASREVGIDQVTLNAAAQSGPEGMLQVMAENDGGDRLVAFNLTRALSRYIARRRGTHEPVANR